jgi:hypothetical protein
MQQLNMNVFTVEEGKIIEVKQSNGGSTLFRNQFIVYTFRALLQLAIRKYTYTFFKFLLHLLR